MGFAYIRIYSEVSKVFGAYHASSVVTANSLSGNQQSGSKNTNTGSKQYESQRPSVTSTSPARETNATSGAGETRRKLSVDEESQTLPKALKKSRRTKDEVKQIALLMQSIAIVGLFMIGWTPYLSMGVYEIITGTK
ncbi:hypothetical protein HDU81_000408, partial [Chytriomyces hyalinus]